MNPDEVERLLQRVEPAPPPERVEERVLAEGQKLFRREPEQAPLPARRGRVRRLREFAGLAAAGLILSVILWRIFVPVPGDPGCQGAIELQTHLDTSAAAGPPAFPTGAPDLEAYAPLFRRADAVKPLAEELRWQRIPWIVDLGEAQRVARAERRPMFVWVSSHDPLGRCCGCAAGLRVGPLSREEVVLRVSAGFVPLALNRNALTKDNGQEFLKSLQRQKSQYHGIWMTTPDGLVLAANEGKGVKGVEGWAREILAGIDVALKAFGPAVPRKVEPADHTPYRGRGAHPDGGVSLAVYARLMHRGARDGPVVLDAVALTAAEWSFLVPPSMTVGAERAASEAVARKFCRIVSPVSDPEFLPRPDQLRTAEFRLTVASIDGATATLRLTGRWETEYSTTEGKLIRASAAGEGVAVFDLQTKGMRSMLLVTTGTFGFVPESRETGAVVEWTASNR
jgi:hypothetical protein